MSGEFAPLFTKGITEHLYVEIDAVKTVYDQIFRVQPTDMRYIDVYTWQTLGLPGRRMGGEPIALGTWGPSYAKRYVVENYALGDTIFEEDVLDDLYGIIHRVLPAKGGMLAASFRVLKERLAANFFKLYGYASGTQLPGMNDGFSLMNTAHPISLQNSDQTFGNRPSVDIDLGIAAAQAAWANIVAQPAPNAVEYMDNAPDWCVVHPNLRQVAAQVYGGANERGTADLNNPNVNAQDNVRVVYWPYWQISGSVGTASNAYNAWMVGAKKNHLEWWNRNDMVIKSDYYLNILSYLWVAYERFSYGAADWRGLYGSLGS